MRALGTERNLETAQLFNPAQRQSNQMTINKWREKFLMKVTPRAPREKETKRWINLLFSPIKSEVCTLCFFPLIKIKATRGRAIKL